MTNKIQTTEATLQPIKDDGSPLPRIAPAQLKEALGAEDRCEILTRTQSPITLFALREKLISRLQSNGGRPALAGTTRRAKIPLSDNEWEQLEKLAAAIASPGFAPSAGQVASVLLSLSLHSVETGVTSGQV